MELWRFIRYVLPWIIAIVVIIYNYYGRRYKLITINSDHVIISRLFMSETSIYFESITKLTVKILPKKKVKLIIVSNDKRMNFNNIDFDLYVELIDFAKENNLTLTKQKK